MSSSALFDATPSCPHALSGPVLRTYVSDSSTQSPDALFSIILKPPTYVFSTTDRPPTDVFLPPTGHRPTFFYPRPVVLNTNQGFPVRRPVFGWCFRHRTQALPLVFSVPIRVPLRPRLTRFACGPQRTRNVTHNMCTSLGNMRYLVLGERLSSRLGNWEMPLVLSKVLGSRLGNWEMPIVLSTIWVHDLAPGRCQSCSLLFSGHVLRHEKYTCISLYI